MKPILYPKQHPKPDTTAGGIKIDLTDDDFGAILNSAIRYCFGRQTYMPSLVIDFITPLLPYLNTKTIRVFNQDLTENYYDRDVWKPFGDVHIDEPTWMKFKADVENELTKRGEPLYHYWKEDLNKTNDSK
jgi:hypothetical protein